MDILLRNYSSTNLKIRLAFLYSLSVFIILVSSGIAIYFFNENYRKQEFSKKLTLEAIRSAAIIYSSPHISADVTEKLNKSSLQSLNHGSLYIYNIGLQLLYISPGSPAHQIPKRYFSQAIAKKQLYLRLDGAEAMILYYNQKGRAYFIITSAIDTFGNRKRDSLRLLLASAVLAGILLSGFLAFLYVRQAMRPLEELKTEIEKIDETNLKKRISLNNTNNEITQIAEKFNAMLDRIEQAFEQRKNFVHHASHELRTPLANMLSQTEAALSYPNNEYGYKKILQSLKEDQQDMIDLTNSLLALSRYEKISFAGDWVPLRIDEILYECIELINEPWPNAILVVDYQTMPEDESQLVLHGNEELIKSAILNLLKNAVQYSYDLKVMVSIEPSVKGIKLQFENKGLQLNPEEQARLFIPFFRGENAGNKKGHGLGLSIVQRIANVHKGSINYETIEPEINRFTIFFPSSK